MGIIGTKGLAGYNAGNTYQAALARYRQSIGQHALCLDLGGVIDEGYVAEDDQLKSIIFQRNKHILPVTMDEVFSMLEVHCFPRSPKFVHGVKEDTEMAIGLNPPAYWQHEVEAVPYTMKQPFWGHLGYHPQQTSNIGDSLRKINNSAKSVHRKRATELVRTMSNSYSHNKIQVEEMGEIISNALEEQIGEILGTAGRLVNPKVRLSVSGLDSLSAIDLRDWVRRIFQVEMSIFEIMEEATLESAGYTIATRLKDKFAQTGDKRV